MIVIFVINFCILTICIITSVLYIEIHYYSQQLFNMIIILPRKIEIYQLKIKNNLLFYWRITIDIILFVLRVQTLFL